MYMLKTCLKNIVQTWVIIMICIFKLIYFCLQILLEKKEKFREKCIEIYGLDPPYIYSAPGLAWQACLKKAEVKLELLTDCQMLLMIEEGIRGGMCQSTHRYAKANNKYMKNYDKSIESSYLKYLDANNLYGSAMS